MSFPMSRAKPSFTSTPRTSPSEYPRVARGRAWYENITSGRRRAFASSATLPPVVMAMSFAPRFFASSNPDSVSSVFPEYDDAITSESRPT